MTTVMKKQIECLRRKIENVDPNQFFDDDEKRLLKIFKRDTCRHPKMMVILDDHKRRYGLDWMEEPNCVSEVALIDWFNDLLIELEVERMRDNGIVGSWRYPNLD